jgi:Ran-interacting Mog1 protein
VPDNQEVFVDQITDASIIVEILEMASQVMDADAARCVLFLLTL